ncbi:hypothetical protein Y032_0036g3342 [Ancylostoma ceylanicum]|uniref:Uncharacterized protein n=1 Tax=Ancylostoma ceylanicum TaxID=53326 RepID=A0A016UML1_9BILA|nr:hypothetical protein Y032_0036g3342 [Ancylostoma ceylanicum]
MTTSPETSPVAEEDIKEEIRIPTPIPEDVAHEAEEDSKEEVRFSTPIAGEDHKEEVWSFPVNASFGQGRAPKLSFFPQGYGILIFL